jgi:hypothetical protein
VQAVAAIGGQLAWYLVDSSGDLTSLTYTVTPFFFHHLTSTPSRARLALHSSILYDL